MPKYIAILRGINVGGKRKILMADLRLLFQELGYTDVQTYIQSGNVVFDTEGNVKHAIGSRVEKQILRAYGFDVPVIVRTAKEIKQAILQNPFLKEGIAIERLYLTFLNEIPGNDKLELLDQYDYSPDRFEIMGNNVFGFSSGKYSDSKYTNNFFEKILKTSATTRNWKTVLKLLEMTTSD